MIKVSLLLSLLAYGAAQPVEEPDNGLEDLPQVINQEFAFDELLSLEDGLEAVESAVRQGKTPHTQLRHDLRDAVAREVGLRPQLARGLPAQVRNFPATSQLAVIEGLGRSGVAEALPALAAMSRARNGLLSFVLESLTRLARDVGGPHRGDVLEAVRHALLVGEPAQRRLAAIAAGVLRDDESIPNLIAMLELDDVLTSKAAHRGLVEHTGIGYAASPSLWERWYREESEFLDGQFQEQLNALRGNDAARRVQAVKAITAGRLARDIRAQALLDFFPDVEEEALQLQLISGLRTLDSRGAVPLLEGLVLDSRFDAVRLASKRALDSLERTRSGTR
ncbi:MAG: hypothetical protein ACI8QS_001903 [Planctomycetota bacterium]